MKVSAITAVHISQRLKLSYSQGGVDKLAVMEDSLKRFMFRLAKGDSRWFLHSVAKIVWLQAQNSHHSVEMGTAKVGMNRRRERLGRQKVTELSLM